MLFFVIIEFSLFIYSKTSNILPQEQCVEDLKTSGPSEDRLSLSHYFIPKVVIYILSLFNKR